MADGVLSDLSHPTVDNTNVEPQDVVTDGATLTDLQTRDTSYTVRPLDPTGMSCRVTTSPDPYFIRLSKTGDPDAAIDDNVGNGGPALDQREGFIP